MDEFDFEAFEPQPLPSARFKKIDLAVLGLNFAYQVSQAVTNVFETLTDLAGMHANYQVDRREFAEDAALEIETLTSPTTSGEEE